MKGNSERKTKMYSDAEYKMMNTFGDTGKQRRNTFEWFILDNYGG